MLPGHIGGPESILGPIGLMGNPSEQSGVGAEDEDAQGSGGASFASQLISTEGLNLDELIDEAVTSGGDNIQWVDDLSQNEEQ